MQSVNVYSSAQTQVYNYDYGNGAARSPAAAVEPQSSIQNRNTQSDEGEDRILKLPQYVALPSRFASLSGQIAGVAGDVNAVKGSVAEVSSQVQQLQGDMGQVKSGLGNIQSSVDKIAGEVDGLKAFEDWVKTNCKTSSTPH